MTDASERIKKLQDAAVFVGYEKSDMKTTSCLLYTSFEKDYRETESVEYDKWCDEVFDRAVNGGMLKAYSEAMDLSLIHI